MNEKSGFKKESEGKKKTKNKSKIKSNTRQCMENRNEVGELSEIEIKEGNRNNGQNKNFIIQMKKSFQK